MSLAETSLETITSWSDEVLLAEIASLESHIQHVYGVQHDNESGERYLALDRLKTHLGFEQEMRGIAPTESAGPNLEQTAEQLRPFVRSIL